MIVNLILCPGKSVTYILSVRPESPGFACYGKRCTVELSISSVVCSLVDVCVS